MLPQQLYRINNYYRITVPEYAFKQFSPYLSVIGAFVTGAVGYLGVSSIAENKDVAAMFAVAIGIIYLAQDASTLIIRGSKVVAKLKHIRMDVLCRNRQSVIKMASVLLLTLGTGSFILNNDAVSDVLGVSKFDMAVKITLVFCLVHLVLSLVSDAGMRVSQCTKKSEESQSELIPLVNSHEKPYEITVEYITEIHVAITKLLEANHASTGKISETDASVALLASKLKVGGEVNLDYAKLKKIDYFLRGAEFWLYHNEIDRTRKKLKKLLQILGVSDPKFNIDNSRHPMWDTISPTLVCLNRLEDYYKKGLFFWQGEAKALKQQKKQNKLERLEALRSMIRLHS